MDSEGAVPPNATLQISLELVSWKSVAHITKDKKILKKILREGEGYDRPYNGTMVQGNMALEFIISLHSAVV